MFKYLTSLTNFDSWMIIYFYKVYSVYGDSSCLDFVSVKKFDFCVYLISDILAPVSKIAKQGSAPPPLPLSALSPAKSHNKTVSVDVSTSPIFVSNTKARLDTG